MARFSLSVLLTLLTGSILLAPPLHAERINCKSGLAEIYDCKKIDMMAHLPLAQIGGSGGNDIWGWTDPLTGRDYALVGRENGTAFVDVSDPETPVYLGDLPTETDPSGWRDVKVYDDYALIVSEARGHGVQIFDLTRLRAVGEAPETFAADVVYREIGSAHNIAVNEETGYAYAVGSRTVGLEGGDDCAGGLHMIDLADPLTPRFAGCFDNDGYTHDVQCAVYRGRDRRYTGREICFAANEDTLTIVDVTDKSAPVLLGRETYEGVSYAHQGWLTPNHHYFLLDDEGDELDFAHPQRTWVWHLIDLEAPRLVGAHESRLDAIDHNLYIVGNYVYQANYSAGLRILELTDLNSATLTEVAFFDTHPEDDVAPGGPSALHLEEKTFSGMWSVYPFFDSGIVIANDRSRGLFVLRPRFATPTSGLGGRVTGLDADSASCRNQSTGALVSIPLAGASSWSCDGAGLGASPGHRIVQSVSGTADGGPISGALTGLAGVQLTCRNRSTGRQFATALSGDSGWDCAATGFSASAGDSVSVTIGGDVRGGAAAPGVAAVGASQIGNPTVDVAPGPSATLLTRRPEIDLGRDTRRRETPRMR